MALFDNVREPSLSFVSDGIEYKLSRPWTNKDILKLADSSLYIRSMLEPESYKKWRQSHTDRKAAIKLTQDSLVTAGIDGKQLYGMLAVLGDDGLFLLLEADLFSAGITIEGLLDGSIPMRRAVAVFMALPSNCAYKRELNKPYLDWDLKEHMLAELVDLMNFQTQLQSINAQVSGWKPDPGYDRPKPIFKRPEEEKPKVFNSLTDLLGASNAGTVSVASGIGEPGQG